MTAMPDKRASLARVTGVGWLLLGLAAWIYARWKGIPEWAAWPIAAAFLIEFPFYLLPAFQAPREWLTRQAKFTAAPGLTASAIAPWLVYSVATGQARPMNLVLLLAVTLVVSYWYVVFPAAPLADALFLVTVAGIYLSKIFDRIYLSPVPGLQLSVLGHVMLIRTAAIAVLVFRGGASAEYRFIPTLREWTAGLRYFAMMLPAIALAYWALGLAQWRMRPSVAALAAFPLVLCVLALSEEFFFRGLLQQWLEQWTGSADAALLAASALFGSAHLGFHRIFPNWRWAAVTAILGIFCGLAWRNTRSVQAAMIAHALTVTVWQFFFLQ